MPVEYDESYTQYQVKRSWGRRLIRQLYLRRAAGLTKGRVLDFGCGVGELLARLPEGSMGLEYNRSTVDFCRQRGLEVEWYDGFADDWALSVLPDGKSFDTLVLSHVLEHFDDPAEILRRLLVSSRRLGVKRVLVIVPGAAGFRIDPTHRTFVDLELIRSVVTATRSAWKVTYAKHFPGNWAAIGAVFPHHELQVRIDLSDQTPGHPALGERGTPGERS